MSERRGIWPFKASPKKTEAPAHGPLRTNLEAFTIAIVMALYVLLLDPVRRNDARMEKLIERFAVSLHRNTAALLSGAGTALAHAGNTLRHTGQHLHKRIACL